MTSIVNINFLAIGICNHEKLNIECCLPNNAWYWNIVSIKYVPERKYFRILWKLVFENLILKCKLPVAKQRREYTFSLLYLNECIEKIKPAN